MRKWRALAMVPIAALLVTGSALAQDEASEESTGSTRLVAPEDCVTEPRPFEDLATILALDGEGISQPDVTQITPPLGTIADTETMTAITDATREIIACFNAGDIPRAAALMTENGVQRVYWGLAADEENRALARERLPAPAEPRASEFLVRLIAVTDQSVLADGRVAAFVLVNEPLLPPTGPETLLFVFSNQDGQWLLDDLVDFSVAPVAPAEE